jgi:renalase
MTGALAKILVVGAGLSGTTVAAGLADHADVTVVDKARGTGGRLSTRRSPENAWFDHGTPWLTCQDPHDHPLWNHAYKDHALTLWHGPHYQEREDGQTIEDHALRFVGVPSMSHLCQTMLGGTKALYRSPVQSLSRQADGWHAVIGPDQVDIGSFDWVILTPPLPQIEALLGSFFPDTLRPLIPHYEACMSLMIGWSDASLLGWHSYRWHQHAAVDCVTAEHTKPRRSRDGTQLVVHSHASWALDHREADDAFIANALMAPVRAMCGTETLALMNKTPNYCAVQRWRYARFSPPASLVPSESAWIDPDQRLVILGDWAVPRGRIDALWSLALRTAERWRNFT